MRTVFLGTSPFASAVLDAVARSEHRPALVVSRPDRPRGRGRKVLPPPAVMTARALGIDAYQPRSVNSAEAVERIAQADPEVVLVCAYGAMLKAPLLDRFDMLNVHPSLLPRWRGAAPIERAIMAGDEMTGVCILRVSEELDAGDVCVRLETRIGPDETAGDLSDRLAALGGRALVEALDAMRDRRLAFEPQGEGGMTYARKIDPAERRLDLRHSAWELERTVRALCPHIGAYLDLAGGGRLKVDRARPAAAEGVAGRSEECDGMIRVFCGDGALDLLVVQPEGKRPMPAGAYLAGHGSPAFAI